jgi:hypothetical protein
LEGRRQSPAGPAVRRLIDRLRLKAEWLDARIELELQQSDPVDAFTVEEMPRSSNAAWAISFDREISLHGRASPSDRSRFMFGLIERQSGCKHKPRSDQKLLNPVPVTSFSITYFCCRMAVRVVDFQSRRRDSSRLPDPHFSPFDLPLPGPLLLQLILLPMLWWTE